MRTVIAVKHKGYWTQAEMNYEEAQVLLRHDTNFEEFMCIVDGKLMRTSRPSTDDAETPEAPPNTHQ